MPPEPRKFSFRKLYPHGLAARTNYLKSRKTYSVYGSTGSPRTECFDLQGAFRNELIEVPGFSRISTGQIITNPAKSASNSYVTNA